MKPHLLIAAAAVVALGVPALASAAPARTQDGDTQEVVVSYADLNLNTAAGQARLDSRIRHAAAEACGERPDGKNLRDVRAFDACVRASIQSATAAAPARLMVAGSSGHNG